MLNKDGSPISVSGDTTSMPAVPEVLCIDLPTGFDASEFNKPTTNSTTRNQVSPQSSLSVEFPSLNSFDECHLSSTGKKFFDQIPDLSFMLLPALNLQK